jgi:hypothetical protein
LFYSKFTNNKYYLNKDDEIQEIKIPHWKPFFSFNYNINNFYFTIPNIFSNNKINSLLIFNLNNLNFNNRLISKDFKNNLPTDFNFQENDDTFLTNYLYIRNSSFIKFFINNFIDVPICFKKSYSLKTKNFELPLLKFSNFLMKQGKKEKVIRLVFLAFRLFFKSIKFNNTNSNELIFSWFNLHTFLSGTFLLDYKNKKNFLTTKIDSILETSYNASLINNDKQINTSFFIKNYLFFLLSKVSPIFSYFIYSVDKNIRKYSRGKSGKYTFIWKFIAPYKRTNLAVRWIIKDIKFNQNKVFSNRLIKTFENLLFFPEKSFSWKSKVFSHNYVFKNFRKSLMSSLKTTS